LARLPGENWTNITQVYAPYPQVHHLYRYYPIPQNYFLGHAYSHQSSELDFHSRNSEFVCGLKREQSSFDSHTENFNEQTKSHICKGLETQIECKRSKLDTNSRNQIIPNYNLKRTMFVYFYHRQQIGHYSQKYPLNLFELKILKKFLIKKLVHDKRKFKVLAIEGLTLSNYIEFLIENPPIYRKNIIKSKLFKKIIKLMSGKISDFPCRYLPDTCEENIEIFRNLNPKKAYNLMTNKFYKKCFNNSLFKKEFFSFLNDEAVIISILIEYKKKFTRHVDNWIDTFSRNLSEVCDLNDEGFCFKIRLNSSREEVAEAISCFKEIARTSFYPDLN
jgi:hypothetical protein